ncbi:hypothetical protein FE257_002182 [Aspergillus nanangensis]|uniref:BHLH domain-containing protein n=1 Tax=Aspergillus nanangensis TaxID=2582783 RepID=A0AAD4CCZ2_ASPNN|nr:hypothetical protein FE257_002182 [Aspergillus nanangensis]
MSSSPVPLASGELRPHNAAFRPQTELATWSKEQSHALRPRPLGVNTTISGDQHRAAARNAHTRLERHRRHKIKQLVTNLKQMVPGCRDQRVGKAVILEASIVYINFLEQTIQKLVDCDDKTPLVSTNVASRDTFVASGVDSIHPIADNVVLSTEPTPHQPPVIRKPSHSDTHARVDSLKFLLN